MERRGALVVARPEREQSGLEVGVAAGQVAAARRGEDFLEPARCPRPAARGPSRPAPARSPVASHRRSGRRPGTTGAAASQVVVLRLELAESGSGVKAPERRPDLLRELQQRFRGCGIHRCASYAAPSPARRRAERRRSGNIDSYNQAREPGPGPRHLVTSREPEMTDRRPRLQLPTRRLRVPTTRNQGPAPEVSMETRPEDVAAPVEQSIVDAAIYRGRPIRIDTPTSSPTRSRRLRERARAAWPGSACSGPSRRSSLPVAEEFGLHEVAVEDAIVAHQRPKLERYGDTLFVVLRAATYLDDVEEVEFGEIHVFVGPNFVLTVRHSRTPGSRGRPPADGGDPELLARGPEACCTRSSTASSTATRRSSPGSRRTSTRSRPRSSAATRRCRGGSTSCRARSSSSSARPGRCWAMLDRADRRVREVPDRRGAPALPARRRRPRDDRRRARRRLPPDLTRHPDGQRDAREPGPERGDQAADRGELRRRTRRSSGSRPGPRSSSRRRSSARSTG